MAKVRSTDSVEKLFPNAAGRKAADEAIDALPVTLTMSAFMEAWETAYFERVGKSPLREVNHG